MKVITAPEYNDYDIYRRSLFVAGGISGTKDWQSGFIQLLEGLDIDVYTPRRKDWDPSDHNAGKEQIEWEYGMLCRANTISFWFPEESVCPITLYELGFWSARSVQYNKGLFVGCHPNYSRRFDVIEQLRLARPSIEVVDSLDALASQLVEDFQFGKWSHQPF